MLMDEGIQLSNICFSRDQSELLRSIDLDIDLKGISVILGPNGAGKSLLLRMMMQLIAPDSGSVRFHGLVPDQAAMVFQKPVLLRRSVADNLNHALKIAQVPKAERAAEISRLLTMARLNGYEARPARQLSGGEQQRLQMVRALASRPRLLFMDEATAHLDPHSTHLIEDLALEVAASGAKIVAVTHDHGQAKRLADDIIFMAHGQIIERSEAHRFFSAPQTLKAQAFLEGKLVL